MTICSHRELNFNSYQSLTLHNLQTLQECEQRHQRYRIKHATLQGRQVAVVIRADSFIDKLISFLPSRTSLKDRFIDSIKAGLDGRELTQQQDSIPTTEEVGLTILKLWQNQVVIPFLNRDDEGRLSPTSIITHIARGKQPDKAWSTEQLLCDSWNGDFIDSVPLILNQARKYHYISEIQANGLASEAALKEGDAILHSARENLTDISTRRVAEKFEPGRNSAVWLYRQGRDGSQATLIKCERKEVCLGMSKFGAKITPVTGEQSQSV